MIVRLGSMWEQARHLIQSAQRPVSFSGAGLSEESGIPTFREAGGMWARFDPTVYASQAGFGKDLGRVIDWYSDRRRAVARARPNPAHVALARHPTMIHITQNIDTLLELAGADRVIHLHGIIDRDRCNAGCGHGETIDLANPPVLRLCPVCAAPMRPDVVWFGESLPADQWQEAEQAVNEADLLLVAGTSAQVWPAAGLIESAVAGATPLIVVNTEPNAASSVAQIEILGKAGTIIPSLLDGR